MDLEILEALALSEDRSGALAALLPGSEDHDYFTCLHAQHRGALADADKVIQAWPDRHGTNASYRRLQLRQLMYRVVQDPATAADELRDQLGVAHWHEAEVAEIDPTRPTRLAAGAFDGAVLLQRGVEYSSDLGQVTDEGLYELFATDLDAARRRVLLNRIGHTPAKQLPTLVAGDLDQRGTQFGSVAVHRSLTRVQLDELVKLRPELRTQAAWIEAVIKRMRPPTSVDLRLDLAAREAYIVELWAFVKTLEPASNSLKDHVLWHLLDTQRRRDKPVFADLFEAFLQLPRASSFAATRERLPSDQYVAANAGFGNATGLVAYPEDTESLVRDLLLRDLANAQRYAKWLDRAWFDAVIAEAQLLTGTGDQDRATRELGPARAADIRERIELTWCLHNKMMFGANEPVAIDVDVKHVPELVVNVFRVDPLAYFQHTKKEVGIELDLDGLAATQEITLRYAEPPVRRVRRHIELPMCTRPGTYVVDLIGNGIASRAVIHKGQLRHVARQGAAGTVVTILDEAGTPQPGARAWVGEREYVADAGGTFAVPFASNNAQLPMLLMVGDLATVSSLPMLPESYGLALDLTLDRQQLTSGRTAKAIATVRLGCSGNPASLALLERTTWEVTLTDRHGVATTKSQPLAVTDEDASVLELPLGDDVASVAVTVRGYVKVISEQREQELVQSQAVDVAQMYATYATEALYLARTTSGYVISALGKSGEPRAQRPVSVVLVHRWSRVELTCELATDAAGRVELGELPGIQRISVTLGASSQTWTFDDPPLPQTPLVQATRVSTDLMIVAGEEAVLKIQPYRTSAEIARAMSLVELRAYAPMRHVTEAVVTPLESAVKIGKLAPGEYHVRAPGIDRVIVVLAPIAVVQHQALVANEVLELSRREPVITSLTVGTTLRIAVENAQRVHVIATRFLPTQISELTKPLRTQKKRWDLRGAVTYVSGRELGDEYRYVLDRRTQRRYPSLILDKPSLLLNPWARRATTTNVQIAGAGRGFAPPPPAQAPGGPSPMAGSRGGFGGGGMAADASAYVGYDFLGEPPVVLANLEIVDGIVEVPLAALGRATAVTIIVDDATTTIVRHAWLAETPLDPRDLRLRVALDPARHALQKKSIQPLRPGGLLEVRDLATAKIHLIDSVEKAHAYLLALRDDSDLREFSWIVRWHAMAESERRERYSKYACHELHLFLYFKDRAFFDAVVLPYLANKRTKTFVDRWLLGVDLASYLEPGELVKLNAVELALLGRSLRAEPALVRILADRVATLPPDPVGEARLVDALLGASVLEGGALGEMQKAAFDRAEMDAPPMEVFASAAAPMAAMAPSPKRSRSAEKMKKESLDDGYAKADMDRRQAEAPMFRPADKTQELAEHNWWHRTPQSSGPDMITAQKLWRDFAKHETGAFLSPWFGLATNSFAEMLVALAVTDLPFIAANHAYVPDGPSLTVTAAGNALAGTSQLVDGELAPSGPPLVVGQSYVRADDRHEYVDGEQVDKYVTSFAAGVFYTCLVVVANPTSSRQRVAALVQIPRGSIAVAGALATQTIDILLEPYATHGHEFSFYFPTHGAYAHFPVHVSRLDQIVAAAPATAINVTSGAEVGDPNSWAHISQHGTVDQVVAFLERDNLAAIDLSKLLWRLRDRAQYDKLLPALERRRVYDSTVWGYALLHRDAARIRVWLRAEQAQLADAGPVLEMIGRDDEDTGAYEHLEFAPLTNARAHKLGPKLKILNEGLATQYERFLQLVAHRPAPTAEDLLAATSYFTAQDRADAALYTLARVQPASVAERMQYDYLAAFAACLAGDPARAREHVTKWQDLAVDRWRTRFTALAAMLDELGGAATQIVDKDNREQLQSDLAKKQPTFELSVDRDGVVLHQQNVATLELRYFEMDVELLFSRQPFVQSDVSRFSFIEPGHRLQVSLTANEQRVPWPAELRGKNVVVEAVGAGLRKAKIHYANELATNVAHQYGQVRVQRTSGGALPTTYIKVYARQRGGNVTFYKDGYTDLRGWFDYATLSTDELDRVERFAILVASEKAGSVILEATPPR